MVIYLLCVLTQGISNTVLAIPHPPDPHYAYTECTVHKTLKEAALAEFNGHRGVSIQRQKGSFNEGERQSVSFYKVDVEAQTMVRVQEPRIRIEVDEK